MRENVVLPGVGRRCQTTRPEEAHHRPEVNGARREQQRDDGQANRHQPGVKGVIALPDAGEVQAARMGRYKAHEGQQRTNGGGSNAVPQHAEPGINLRDFFPPVVLDDEIGGCRNGPTEKGERH